MQTKKRFNQARSLCWLLASAGLIMLFCLGLAGLARAAPPNQSSAEGQELYQQYCIACHTLGGGRLVGPDLQDVTLKRDPAWLRDFILEPDKMIDAEDPLALQLLAESNNVRMPALGLSPAQVEAILAYLENPQGGPPAAAPPLPAGGDVHRGKALFSGAARLENGGMACIACHTSSDFGSLGGGSLGPDLAQAYSRFGGPGLAAALQGLPFPTMRGIFDSRPLTTQEQADLYAYLEAAAGRPMPEPDQAGAWFLGLSALGAAGLFGLMVIAWPRQRQSLSERLRRKR